MLKPARTMRAHHLTRASGISKVVLARYARNKRLSDASYLWAFAATNASPGACAFYRAR